MLLRPHTCKWSNVPGDVVAPADGLHPVHSAGVEPYQVTWSLDEAVHGYISLIEVLQIWPPRAHEKVDIVPEGASDKRRLHRRLKRSTVATWQQTSAQNEALLFTEVAHHTPVRLWHSKPFTVSRPDVNVDCAEIVVLLVTYGVTQKQKLKYKLPNTPTHLD